MMKAEDRNEYFLALGVAPVLFVLRLLSFLEKNLEIYVPPWHVDSENGAGSQMGAPSEKLQAFEIVKSQAF